MTKKGKDASWNLARKPTSAERFIGLLGAMLLCVAGGIVLWFSLTTRFNVWMAGISGVLFVFSTGMLSRFLLTSGQPLGRRGVRLLAFVFIFAGSGMLISSVLVRGTRNPLLIAAIGLVGISGGVLNLTQVKR